jgi:hypothetical protein
MFAWQWLLGRGPKCSGYALQKWLGVATSYLPYMKKRLPLDKAESERQYEEQVALSGAPTLEALREARAKSRNMRARGLLRTQPRWKEIREPGQRTKSIPAKVAAVTLVLDGQIPLEPPDPSNPAWRRRRAGRPRRKRLRIYSPGRTPHCSKEQALENLKKATKPRPWRSPSESRLIRMFVWQWAVGRGPHCSQYALARWLGIDQTYVRILKRKLLGRYDGLRNGVRVDSLAEFLEAVRREGAPTLERLARAREESRWMRSENLLRTQRTWKTVKCAEYAGATFYEWIRTRPANVTLVLDGVTPLAPPSRVKPGQAAPDEFSTRMWQLRIKAEAAKGAKPVLPRRWRRGRR